MNADQPPLDDDALPGDPGRVDALWIHGLLRSLAESPQSRAARLDEFARRLEREVRGPVPRVIPLRAAVRIGIAAAVLLAVLGGFWFWPTLPSAQAMIIKSLQAAERPLTLHYTLEVVKVSESERTTVRRGAVIMRGPNHFVVEADAPLGKFRVVGDDGKTWVIPAIGPAYVFARTAGSRILDVDDDGLSHGYWPRVLESLPGGFAVKTVGRETLADRPASRVVHVQARRPDDARWRRLKGVDFWADESNGLLLRLVARVQPAVGLVQPRELVLNYTGEGQVDDSYFDPASYLDGSRPVLHMDGITDPTPKGANKP